MHTKFKIIWLSILCAFICGYTDWQTEKNDNDSYYAFILLWQLIILLAEGHKTHFYRETRKSVTPLQIVLTAPFNTQKLSTCFKFLSVSSCFSQRTVFKKLLQDPFSLTQKNQHEQLKVHLAILKITLETI